MQPFSGVIVHCKRGINQTFEGLLDIDSKFKPIPRDQKFHCGAPIIVEVNGSLK